MAELKQETIEIINKLNEVIKDSSFRMNKFEVMDNYDGEQIILIDIREVKQNE